ncbi:MAG: hypothetical protein JNL87_14425 [Burkholderiaceae bacterium]|nr:hypothetical protein [Burkholderiaceae bacterium]
MAGRYTKTEAGRAEIRERSRPLSRPARNLLLIIDDSRPAGDWLGVVQGCAAAELQALVDAGLVERPATPAAARPARAAAAAPRMSLAQALETRDHRLLCRRLLAEARPRLGMVKGYWLALEVDHCQTPADVRVLALRFVEQVRAADGDAAAMALAQVLIAPE